MTEKRFWSEDYSVRYYTEIVDNEKELKDVPNPKKNLTIEEVVDTLNELAEEKEYYQIKSGKCEEELLKLRRDNEQLKNKIDILEDDNETYHKSLEKLNLYTKRFIPTKCTNEFKDCKTNRYYWLDHEGNFEGCLELLNLLDCENEVLKSENRQLQGRLMEYEEQIKGD